MELICSHEQCTGCSLCAQVCPTECISMTYDIDGFMFPLVHEKQCVSCGVCSMKCPVNNEPKRYAVAEDVYVLHSNDHEVMKTSQSGGAVREFARYMIKEGGYVFGVEWENNFMNAKHNCTDNFADTLRFAGSKYIGSVVGDSYVRVKQILDSGKPVLFTGTPCQIAGITNFLQKPYESLYTIDFICYGVGSTSVYREALTCLSKSMQPITKVELRHKDNRYSKTFGSFVVQSGNKTVFQKPFYESLYGLPYAFRLIHRLSCQNCRYADIKRVSDVTVADNPHGESIYEKKFGSSYVFANSDKGKVLISNILQRCTAVRHSTRNANVMKKVSKRYFTPGEPSVDRDAVFQLLRKEGFDATAKKYFKRHIKSRVRDVLSSLLPHALKSWLRKMRKMQNDKT